MGFIIIPIATAAAAATATIVIINSSSYKTREVRYFVVVSSVGPFTRYSVSSMGRPVHRVGSLA